MNGVSGPDSEDYSPWADRKVAQPKSSSPPQPQTKLSDSYSNTLPVRKSVAPKNSYAAGEPGCPGVRGCSPPPGTCVQRAAPGVPFETVLGPLASSGAMNTGGVGPGADGGAVWASADDGAAPSRGPRCTGCPVSRGHSLQGSPGSWPRRS